MSTADANRFDFLIAGGGMAGASAGAFLADAGHRVALLEREDALAYHTTGRSAALYLKIYGNAPIRALTAASEPFFLSPPGDFAPDPLLTPRGALQVGGPGDDEALDALFEEVRGLAPSVRRIDADEARTLVPVLRAERVSGAVYEPQAMDMDVHAIHSGFVRRLRAAGGQVLTRAGIEGLERSAGRWLARTPRGEFTAPVLIDAAGAWGDELARLAGAAPVGLVPKRRTAILFEPPEGIATGPWPLTVDVHETVYFKPDAGALLASPADETPSPPCDARPEEIDIALVADRIQTLTTLAVPRITHRWAGLRTFVPDKTPVVGFDDAIEGFFWLVGQGGYGIQTAPALGRVAAALAAGDPIPEPFVELGVDTGALGPARLRSR